jgi:hypothetical protein
MNGFLLFLLTNKIKIKISFKSMKRICKLFFSLGKSIFSMHFYVGSLLKGDAHLFIYLFIDYLAVFSILALINYYVIVK